MKKMITNFIFMLGTLMIASSAFAGYPGLEYKNNSENPSVSDYLASENYFEDLYSIHDLISFLHSRLILKSVHLRISDSPNDHSGSRVDFKNHLIEIRVANDPAQCDQLCFRQMLAKNLIRLVLKETADPALTK
jgi:hypothetical protein